MGQFIFKNIVKDSFKKKDVPPTKKKNTPRSLIVKNIWLKHLFCICVKLNFLSKRQLSQVILLGLIEKTNQQYVIPTLAMEMVTN